MTGVEDELLLNLLRIHLAWRFMMAFCIGLIGRG